MRCKTAETTDELRSSKNVSASNLSDTANKKSKTAAVFTNFSATKDFVANLGTSSLKETKSASAKGASAKRGKGSDVVQAVDPRHVALIMDGNGRWAKARLMPRQMGHREGLKAIEAVTQAAAKQGVEYLSFFAFSTENWRRPKQEVDSLMNLLKTRLPKVAKQMKEHGFSLVFSGDMSAFDGELRDIIVGAEVSTRTSDKPKSVVNICLNYGGRQEIVNAANRAIVAGKRVSEDEFSRFLYRKDLPDPDLLIRTGGERRISNFMLFQLAYAELYFTDKLWPDFGESDFNAAIEDYKKRARRFGGV